MPQRLADRRPRRRVPKPQRLVVRPRQDALAVRRIDRAIDRALVPQRLADRRPRRRVPKPERLVVRPRQDALPVRRIDRAIDRVLMPQRLADRRPRRRVPKPERLVVRPRQDALAVRRIDRAIDRAAVVQDRDRRMFGERKRKISDGVSQHRPFKDARAARPGRQRKLDAVERSPLARGGARQRRERMRLVGDRRLPLGQSNRRSPQGDHKEDRQHARRHFEKADARSVSPATVEFAADCVKHRLGRRFGKRGKSLRNPDKVLDPLQN